MKEITSGEITVGDGLKYVLTPLPRRMKTATRTVEADDDGNWSITITATDRCC